MGKRTKQVEVEQIFSRFEVKARQNGFDIEVMTRDKDDNSIWNGNPTRYVAKTSDEVVDLFRKAVKGEDAE